MGKKLQVNKRFVGFFPILYFYSLREFSYLILKIIFVWEKTNSIWNNNSWKRVNKVGVKIHVHVIINHIHKDNMNLLKKKKKRHVTAQLVQVLVLVSGREINFMTGNKICQV